MRLHHYADPDSLPSMLYPGEEGVLCDDESCTARHVTVIADTRNVDELLADLRERIDRGVDELEEVALDYEGGREEVRLLGKASGLLVVRDWLRSYDTQENVGEPK